MYVCAYAHICVQARIQQFLSCLSSPHRFVAPVLVEPFKLAEDKHPTDSSKEILVETAEQGRPRIQQE